MAMTRRQFVVSAATASVGAGLLNLPTVLAQNRGSQHDLFGGFPIGVQSYSLRNFELAETVRHIQGLGLHFAEFYSKHLPLDASAARIQETLKLLSDADIRLVAHGVNDFTKDDAANRKILSSRDEPGSAISRPIRSPIRSIAWINCVRNSIFEFAFTTMAPARNTIKSPTSRGR